MIFPTSSNAFGLKVA